MKRLMILIIITAFFTACDKDDDPIVFPKSIAEMNAERILSYKVNQSIQSIYPQKYRQHLYHLQ